jgi:DNA-binding response OmpR family regulator
MGAILRGKILLVEDEHQLRRLIAEFLVGEGLDVIEAGDGREGVDLFLSLRPFDLVLLDLNLPVMPGVEVCRQIKHHEPAQPIIICSAAILDGHTAALSALEVNQFLSKPYHPAELLNRIAIELERVERRLSEPPTSLAALATWRADPPANRPSPAHRLVKHPVID